jgi:hypothetical protein
MWVLDQNVYKGVDKIKTKIMDIHGYASFALGVLLLLGLILLTWMALWKIWNTPM